MTSRNVSSKRINMYFIEVARHPTQKEECPFICRASVYSMLHHQGINAGRQTLVCSPVLPDYPMVASVTEGRPGECCKSIKVPSLTYRQG